MDDAYNSNPFVQALGKALELLEGRLSIFPPLPDNGAGGWGVAAFKLCIPNNTRYLQYQAFLTPPPTSGCLDKVDHNEHNRPVVD
jgi:hypothetical protein